MELQESTPSSMTTPYKCSVCRDLGMVEFEKEVDGEIYSFWRECDCLKAKNAERLIRNSGLGEMIDEQTFDTFRADKPFQTEMLDMARRYADTLIDASDTRKPWLYMGGNPGCGKTHICTAVCGYLLRNKIPVRYMQWNEESRKLKAHVHDSNFEALCMPYINAPVLYVDDLFKQQFRLGGPYVNDPDIRLAFTVLDGRYTRNLPTIISSEWYLIDELLPVDEGVFSRVYERCKGYTLSISRDAANNYRLARVKAM